ncbi:MAG: DUF11 domain-containing protein, partial [Actinomycetota bacterium]|nr:DUF11 domain-containing protein [Actinomycetota bacterium]
DDTEATNWDEPLGGPPINVQQPQVTVDLPGDAARTIRRVQVSALLHTGQNRFTALRQFSVATCVTGTSTANPTCNGGMAPVNGVTPGFTVRYTSPEDAFPGFVPRPVAPEKILRNFALTTAAQATHVQIRALDNQCTGNPQFQGEQDADPLNDTDCRTGNPGEVAEVFGDFPQILTQRSDEVHIAEFQVFSSGTGTGTGTTPPPTDGGGEDPVVTLTKTGPATARPGDTITYTLTYHNLGPAAASSSKIVDTLPAGVAFVSASDGGRYSYFTRKVTWNLGTVPAGASGTRTLRVRINTSVAPGSTITNKADYSGYLVTSPPTATWSTLIEG